MKPVAYHIQTLRADFSRRQRSNPSYSLRAFGRDIGLHPATLSQVLNGKRPLPISLGVALARKLKLSPKESTLFQESVMKKQALLDQIRPPESEDTRFLLDESHYRVIAEWEHFAVLTLMDLNEFDSSSDWIARRLGVSKLRIEAVLQTLLEAKLIRERGGKLEKLHTQFRTTEDVKSDALRASHLENLKIAGDKLESASVDERDYSSTMFAIDPKKIPEFKAIIRQFREKAAALSQTGERTEVYQMAIQFYPISQTEKKQKEGSK